MATYNDGAEHSLSDVRVEDDHIMSIGIFLDRSAAKNGTTPNHNKNKFINTQFLRGFCIVNEIPIGRNAKDDIMRTHIVSAWKQVNLIDDVESNFVNDQENFRGNTDLRNVVEDGNDSDDSDDVYNNNDNSATNGNIVEDDFDDSDAYNRDNSDATGLTSSHRVSDFTSNGNNSISGMESETVRCNRENLMNTNDEQLRIILENLSNDLDNLRINQDNLRIDLDNLRINQEENLKVNRLNLLVHLNCNILALFKRRKLEKSDHVKKFMTKTLHYYSLQRDQLMMAIDEADARRDE